MTAVKRTSRQTATQDVQTLRAELESRLSALEEALANPARHASLESLILDLARVATDEADATARQAVQEAQSAGHDAAAALRGEAASALDAEKKTAAGLRQSLDKAQSELKDERRRSAALEKAVEQARGELQAGRTSIETQQREIAAKLQEFAARHQALDERFRSVDEQLRDEQAAHAASRAQMEHARAEAEAERASAARLLERNADLDQHLEAARAEAAGLRRELEETRRELEGTCRERDAARLDADALRLDADGSRQAQSESQAERERVINAAQDAARDADARAVEALRAHDELKRELAAAREAIGERDALLRELETAHEQRDAARAMYAAASALPVAGDGAAEDGEETVVDLTTETRDEEMQRAENHIRRLELALRDAETRAESAELELQRRTAQGLPEPEPVEAAGLSSVAAATKEPAFRGPARGARRVPITTEVDIQIDAAPGKLVDLSMTGAQVLTSFPMKPNRLVKVTLPMGDSLIACKAKVMWSRLEPKSGELWYRAGVAFTSADQIALEAFLDSHRKDL